MKPYSHNPRKITDSHLVRLEDTLYRLGDLGGIVHNLETDEVIGGNQRARVFGEASSITMTEESELPDDQGTVGRGYIVWRDKKYAYRQVRWDDRTASEANIRANVGAGDWDWDIMAEWNPDDLLQWGFDSEALSSLREDLFHVSELLQGNTLGVPELDDQLKSLEKKYGENDDRNFWPVINLRVSPETMQLFRSLIVQFDGEDEAEKFTNLLGAVLVTSSPEDE